MLRLLIEYIIIFLFTSFFPFFFVPRSVYTSISMSSHLKVGAFSLDETVPFPPPINDAGFALTSYGILSPFSPPPSGGVRGLDSTCASWSHGVLFLGGSFLKGSCRSLFSNFPHLPRICVPRSMYDKRAFFDSFLRRRRCLFFYTALLSWRRQGARPGLPPNRAVFPSSQVSWRRTRVPSFAMDSPSLVFFLRPEESFCDRVPFPF